MESIIKIIQIRTIVKKRTLMDLMNLMTMNVMEMKLVMKGLENRITNIISQSNISYIKTNYE